jgi:site-specific DNA-methyltransferase (adenine-specific)
MITGQTETYIDFSIKPNIIVFGDCLDKMSQISDKSINMILVDPPFGSTTCSWDIIIPFDKLWEQYRRIIKDNGAILIFGTEPFSSMLRLSNLSFKVSDFQDVPVKVSKRSISSFANVI